uniref:ABC transporter permease n=1 Tax=Roseihalotalea indica TaxID=2867963 RepID=A0AA49JH25_9BACT|nr:ABC transporter permease [Tunicatimonas sp. TK19036]
MIKNYLRIAYRNLLKNRVFSLINILGLAIGMAACLLILQYVSFELSFDSFHEQGENIYRVVNDRYQNGKLIQHGTITYSPVGTAMNEDFDEVVGNTEIFPVGEVVITHQDKRIVSENTLATDSSFLNLFSFPVLAGNTATALQDQHAVVLTAAQANIFFNKTSEDWEDFIGETIRVDNMADPFTVTAIIDVPENSHLQFSMLMRISAIIDWTENENSRWTWSDFYHYVQLLPGVDHKEFETKLAGFSEQHFKGNQVSGSVEQFYLQPLPEAHLYSNFEYEIGEIASGTAVWALLFIAIVILAIAWINYINLATARSLERAKEVGIRKVVGAHRGQLIGQYMMEALLVNVLGIIIALTIIQLVQFSFNQVLQQDLSLLSLLNATGQARLIILLLVGVSLLGIFMSGFYPAFVLSSYKPIKVLRGKFSQNKGGSLLRKSLVVTQFAASVILIAGSLIVYRQISFIQQQELGVTIDQVVVVRSPDQTQWDSTYIDRVNSFKADIKGESYIREASTSNRVPGQRMGRLFNVRSRYTEEEVRLTSSSMGIDADFVSLYDVQLLAGRNFRREDSNTDWDKLHTILLNESAVNLLGFSSQEEALGETVWVGDKPWEVVGVVSDFHQQSLRYPIEPILFQPTYSTYNPISVKLSTQQLPDALQLLEEKYTAFFPNNPFDYYFLDERFQQQYQQDLLFGKVFGLFTALALFVSCIGLFGLSSYTIFQRTKEIGIRKILGASIPSVVQLLSRDFMKLVLISGVVGLPFTYFVMQRWLENFAFRISISWWLLALPIILILLIAILTVSFQTIRAALVNPAESLRNE